MEYKQESTQSKAPSKSFKRRQRRREAAALQKLASSVISQKIESSVELPKKLSDEFINILSKNASPDGNSKNQHSVKNCTSEPNPISKSIGEKPKCEQVTQNKLNKKLKASKIPLSDIGSNEKKDPVTDKTCAIQCTDGKEKRSPANSIETDNNLRTHELCPSAKASCSARNLKKINGKNPSQVSVVDLKASGSAQESFCSCKISLVESVKNTVSGGSNSGKVEKNKDPGHGEVKEKQKELDDFSKKKKQKPLNKSSDNSVSQDLLIEEKSKKKIDSSLSKGNAKAGNILNTLENSTSSVSEGVNQLADYSKKTGITSDTPQVHLEITLKEQSVIPENLNENQGDASLVSKMDKSSEKVSDKKQTFSNKTIDVKCVPGVTDGSEGITSVKSESQKDASDREKIKAEREARKAAKLLKKQKEKVVKDDAGSSTEVSSQSKTDGKSCEPVVKNDLLPTATQESESNVSNKSKADKVKQSKPVNDLLPTVTKESESNVSNKSKADKVKQSKPVNDLLPTVTKESESNVSSKSKAELRAERRAKQETQRAAKAAAAASSVTTPAPKKVSTAESSNIPQTQKSKGPVFKGRSVKVVRKSEGAKLLNRFGLGESRSQNWKENSLLDTQSIHPAVVQLGTRFTDRIISGSNARCIAFVQAIKKAIQDYETPPQKELARDLESCLLTPSLEYLEAQRPHAVSVSNATRFLKWQLTQLQPLHDSPSEKKVAVPDEEAKQILIEGLDSYIWEKIEVAEKAVCLTLMDKIKNGDVILTYGCSYLLQQIFLEAKKAGTMFKVVVVDGRPWKEGREMLRSLVSVGIPCSYVLLSAASSVMRQVNKVILGAHALLSNGYVMSRVGVSQVALLASAHNVPVLVACETHKFCERVQSDSFVYNEMGEPDGLSQLLGGEEGPLSGWKNLPNLSLLNLSYDVTPPELVTAVATELAVLPCTSVPVVLRVRPMEPVSCRH